MRLASTTLRLIRPAPPRTGARSARAALLGLALVATGVSLAAPLRDERPLADGSALYLRIEAGDVSVRPGDVGRAVVEADLQPGQRLLWREAADRLVLVIDDRERLTPRAATLRLQVPAESPLVLHLGDAALDLEGVGGARLVVRGGRGDVRVTSSSTQVDIDTGAGRIEAAVSGASLRANSVGGSQRLEVASTNRLVAATVSGALDVRLGKGALVRLASVSGRVDLTVDDTAGLDARIDTLGGGIGLRVPGGEPFNATVAQAQGPLTVPDAIERRPDGSLRSGEGGGTIRLASFSGAIDIATSPAAGAAGVRRAPDP